MNSYFSVSDANEILPLVIKKCNYAKKAKAEVMKMEQQLTSEITPTTSLEEYTINKRKLNSSITKILSINRRLGKHRCILEGTR